MSSPAQTILLNKLTAVLADLQESGAEDGEAMFMLGAGADHLCSSIEVENWPAFRQRLDARAMTGLLAQIDSEGQAALAEGKAKHAYALQALGLSLTATGFSQDEAIRNAAALLDEVIARALALYRQNAPGPARPN